MKIIIVGAGKVGTTLTNSLLKEGHEVLVIDKDQKKIMRIVDDSDANGMEGDCLERQTLIEAGVANAELFISCTSKDEVNILSSVLAKKLGAKKTVARVRDPQYFNEVDNMREDLGLDYAFNPEYRASKDILRTLQFPSALSVERFAHGSAMMLEFAISEGNPLIGMALKEIGKTFEAKILVGMVKRDKEIIIPRGDFVIEENDNISIIATESELKSFCKKIKLFKPAAKSVVMIGGGKIGYYLGKELTEAGISFKILEKDIKRCEELSLMLPSATIINADGTNQDVLNDEGVKNSDAFISLTGMDEENIITSLYALGEKVDKVITKVDNISLIGMAKRLGLYSIVCPKVSISNYIISFVRGVQSTFGDDEIKVLYKLNDKVEAVEFLVGENFESIGVPISELKIRKQALIGGIVRDGEYIFPSGDATINKGDRVIVVTAVKQVAELGDILK